VTADGEPRLLDFGVAKDMSARTETTSLLPMTARYASPEQLGGEILSTASDIYSLGVVLYEILTDCSPYDTESPLELIQQITETIPRLMSHKLLSQNRSASRVLSGDLDTIVAKALHKEQDRRYVSVQRLADDIESYLSNRPVKARSDSLWYRSHRFIRRNWTMVSVVVIALVTVVTAVWIQQDRVINERDIATLERDKLRQTKEFMVGLFKISDPGQARGSNVTARELLDRGLRQIEQGLGEQPEFKSELMLTMGVVYRELGLYDTSSTLLEDALQLRQQYFPTGSVELAESMDQLGTLLLLRGEHESALVLHKDALAIYQKKYDEFHPQIVNSYLNIGYDFFRRGEYEQAEQYYDKSLAIGLETLGDRHESIARAYVHLGTIRGERGEYNRSIEYIKRGIAIYAKTLGDDHPDIAYAYSGLARDYYRKGDIDLAIEFMEKTLAIYTETLGVEHPKVALTGYNNIGILYSAKGEHDQAIGYYNKSLSLAHKSLGNDHPRLAASYTNLGFAYFEKGDYEQAIENNEKAVSILIKAFGEDFPNLAAPYDNLGRIYQAKGENERALAYYNKAYTLWLEKLGPEHPETVGMVAAIANLTPGK
jgi:tetratricopeptide (TPR) repeat protein